MNVYMQKKIKKLLQKIAISSGNNGERINIKKVFSDMYKVVHEEKIKKTPNNRKKLIKELNTR